MLLLNRRSVRGWTEDCRDTHDPSRPQDDARAGRLRKWTDICSVWLQAFLWTTPVKLGYLAGNGTVRLRQKCSGLTPSMQSQPKDHAE